MVKYKISDTKRKYTTTPIVEVIVDENGNEKEIFITSISLPKKDGDVLSKKIVELLNLNK